MTSSEVVMRNRRWATTATALTFLAVVICLTNQACRQNRSLVLRANEPATAPTPSQSIEEPIAHPGVKRVYVGHNSGKLKAGAQERVSLVVFYEDGQWGRITPIISRTRRGLKVRCEELCTAELGTWQDDGQGNVVFVSKTFVCPVCPLLREETTRRPIEEVWRYDRKNLRNRRANVICEPEKYELLDTARLSNYQSLYLPFELKFSGIIY